jgi:tetratricopeptide (TPR) repeat protein
MQETERLAHCKPFLFFILLSLVINPKNITAQRYPDAKLDSLLKHGIELIVEQQYNDASIVFKKIKNEFPDLPFGEIYLAANKIAEAYDYAEPFDEKFITENLELAKSKSEKLLEYDENNIWYNYFLALTEGYTAYFDALNENWLSAFSTGLSSLKLFEECLDKNDDFYESYIALGTYEYWKSRKTEFMQWLPFVDDDTDDAIEKLKVAADSASYNSYLAINSLLWVYIDQKKFKSAAELAKNALIKFPDSRSFKWGLARAIEESDPLKSITFYYEILTSYSPAKFNRINEITLKHLIAQRYYSMGNLNKAKELCDEILSINDLSDIEKKTLSERLDRITQFKTELTSRLAGKN